MFGVRRFCGIHITNSGAVIRDDRQGLFYGKFDASRCGTHLLKAGSPFAEMRHRRISFENNEKYVDSTVTVLVDSLSKRKNMNTVNARTFSNKLVHFEGDESMIGKYISVKIDRAGVYELYATQIDK